MIDCTHIPEAPWWVICAVDKKKARLNCIHHLLSRFPYSEVERPLATLPERAPREERQRQQIVREIIVPEVY